jgi:DUF1680 family protein
VTGAAGSRHLGEAFGQPHELPNDLAYGERCAAIGSVMRSWRMLLATGQARFAALIERTLYNAVRSGISLDGARYVNPLASNGEPERLGRGGCQRKAWQGLSCPFGAHSSRARGPGGRGCRGVSGGVGDEALAPCWIGLGLPSGRRRVTSRAGERSDGRG